MIQRLNTKHEHQERINDSLYLIHRDLSKTLDIKKLAEKACYSLHHFQRIFKEVTGESVHDYVRRSRLEWAANLLIFNVQDTIMDIANGCGFQSNASFSHAFKSEFGCSPLAWRRGGFEQKSQNLKQQWAQNTDDPHRLYHEHTLRSTSNIKIGHVEIRKLPEQSSAYLRHTGYDRSIKESWQKLILWAEVQGIKPAEQEMISLLHSNPDLVPFDECRYVCCLTLPKGYYRSSGIGTMDLPGGLYACSHFEGKFGDLLYLMRAFYHEWLPQSDYLARSIPPQVHHEENHFINESGRFVVEFCVPVVPK